MATPGADDSTSSPPGVFARPPESRRWPDPGDGKTVASRGFSRKIGRRPVRPCGFSRTRVNVPHLSPSYSGPLPWKGMARTQDHRWAILNAVAGPPTGPSRRLFSDRERSHVNIRRPKATAFRLDAGRVHQSYGQFTNAQSPDVQGGVLIGGSDMPTRLADEFRLALAVALLAVAAAMAGPAGVAGVDPDHRDARQLGLVRHEGISCEKDQPESRLRASPPRAVTLCLIPVNSSTAIARAGALCGRDDRLADARGSGGGGRPIPSRPPA